MLRLHFALLAALLLAGCGKSADNTTASDQAPKQVSSAEAPATPAESKEEAAKSEPEAQTSPASKSSTQHVASGRAPHAPSHFTVPPPPPFMGKHSRSGHFGAPAGLQTESGNFTAAPINTRLPKIWNAPDQPQSRKIEVWSGTERSERDAITGQ